MKRILPFLLLLALAIPLAAGSGNVWIHASYRQTFFAGEIWDYIPQENRESLDKGGLGMHLAVALEFTPGTSLGISVEYLQLQTGNVLIESLIMPVTAQALPVLITYRQYSGPLFIQVDAGICFWNGDKGGRDKTIAVGGGYTWPLTKWLNLDCSLRGLFIFSDTLLVPVILSAGVSARL